MTKQWAEMTAEEMFVTMLIVKGKIKRGEIPEDLSKLTAYQRKDIAKELMLYKQWKERSNANIHGDSDQVPRD